MDNQDNFKSLDDQFRPLTFSFTKNLLRLFEEEGRSDNKSGFKVVYVYVLFGALALLIYVGVDIVKLLFRSNFGKKGFSFLKAFLGSIAFGGLAWLNYDLASTGSTSLFDEGDNTKIYYATSIFYGIVATYILIKAIYEKIQSNKIANIAYRGDSTVLSFLIKGGWTQSKVQNLAEPLLILAMGVFFSGLNLFWGLPLVFCAISVWVYMIAEAMFGLSQVRDILANKGYNETKKTEFVEIKS